MNTREPYDVIIMGTGIAGSMLGAVLARHGKKVLLLDGGAHPRFAIGESTIPYTSMMFRILATRYDVPEFLNLASFKGARENITAACGEKRNFGFVYHRKGMPQNREEITQFVIPRILHSECHFFRQDVDAYIYHTALRYGAEGLMNTFVDQIDIGDDGVSVVARSGEVFHGRFLVDGTGFRSPLAHKLGLRETPTSAKTHSRSLFTHMVGVKPYDACLPRGAHGQPSQWSQGTLHHLFDGGWLWVIPFDNHEGAPNPLCSVGLQLDPRRYPPTDMPPEEEFRTWLKDYPDIAPQFAQARAVRDWVAAPRLQYTSTKTFGARWCLLSHSGGFVDPLFSRGLTNTGEILNALSFRLLDALDKDDFTEERFAYVDRLQQNLVHYADELVAGSYTSWRSFRLWNAWWRLWALGTFLGTFRLVSALGDFYKSKDPDTYRALDRADHPGFWFPNHPGYYALWQKCVAMMDRVQADQVGEDEAAAYILRLVGEADYFPPALRFWDAEQRIFNVTPPVIVRNMIWSHTRAPREMKEMVPKAFRTMIQSRILRRP